MFWPLPHIVLSVILLVFGWIPTGVPDPQALGTLLPYGTHARAFDPPPAGYHPVFVESLNRHGSRALASRPALDRVRATVAAAAGSDDLTARGTRLAPALDRLLKANRSVGFGRLSTLGTHELEGIGRRIGPFVQQATRPGDSVTLTTSGVSRAIASSTAFGAGLRSVSDVPVTAPRTDLATLQFDRYDRAFLAFRAHDRATATALDQVNSSAAVRRATTSLLRRLFSARFVRTLADPFETARDIYSVVSIAPALAEDDAGALDEFVTPADAGAFEVATSARYFYQFGPGLAGRDDSFRAAKPLVEDFFTQIDRRLDGGRSSAVFRFGHIEQVVPFAAYLRLPGSRLQATPGTPLTPADNPWRGANVGRLATNIQWLVYDNRAHEPIVAMRYDEVPTRFGGSCTPLTPLSTMYRLSELKRCLRR